MSAENGSGPISWRDTYSLVSDTRREILAAIGDVKDEITKRTDDHEERIAQLELDRARRDSANQMTKTILGASRATVALVASLVAIVVGAVSLVTMAVR